MCAVLRERVAAPRGLMALRGRTDGLRSDEDSKASNLMRACLGFAEQLASYHDRAAAGAIRGLQDSLDALPESFRGLHSWRLDPFLVLREDLRRIEDPNAPELMECRKGTSWRLTRSTAEIVGVYRVGWTDRIRVDAAGRSEHESSYNGTFGRGSPWLRIHPNRRRLDRVFALLESGTGAWIAPRTGSYRSVNLRIRFDGGLAGDLSADESGSVSWNDNTRIEPRGLSGQNLAAARAIIELADTAPLGFVDWDGVSLEQRRQAAAPPR